MIKLRTLLLSAILALLSLPTFAADLCRPPVVDGTFSTIEWADAVRVATDIFTPEGDKVPGEVWITNDHETIYVAIRHSYSRVTTNSNVVSFDVNHSTRTDFGDDELVANWSIWGEQSGTDTFRGSSECPTCSYADVRLGGTNDITVGSALGVDGWFTTEIAHPLSGADGYDVKAAPGQYLALRFTNRIFNADGQIGDTSIPLDCPRYVTYRVRACGQQ